MQLYGLLTIKGMIMTYREREVFEHYAGAMGYNLARMDPETDHGLTGYVSPHTAVAHLAWNEALRHAKEEGPSVSASEQEGFEYNATHLGYICTMIGEKYSLYTAMAWKLWNLAIRWERKRVAEELKTQEGLRQERPGT